MAAYVKKVFLKNFQKDINRHMWFVYYIVKGSADPFLLVQRNETLPFLLL